MKMITIMWFWFKMWLVRNRTFGIPPFLMLLQEAKLLQSRHWWTSVGNSGNNAGSIPLLTPPVSSRPPASLTNHPEPHSPARPPSGSHVSRSHSSSPCWHAPRVGQPSAAAHDLLLQVLDHIEVPMMSRYNTYQSVREYIEVFYNRQRLHSSIGYVAPCHMEMIYEQSMFQLSA
jgi:hypothetical protein